MKRIFLLLLTCLAAIPLIGQVANSAHVTNLGGGRTTGGNMEMIYSIGDFSVSENVALGGEWVVYGGFIPGSFIRLSFGLKKDSAVLVAIYRATGGDTWTNKTGWLTDPNVANWRGVRVENQRVIAFELPGNNLQNDFPAIVTNLDRLGTLNVSNNDLKKFPDVSKMPNLSFLVMDRNDFSFDDIAPNRTISNVTYAPQSPYGQAVSDTVAAGQSFAYHVEIPGATTYQWQFDPFSTTTVDFSNVAGANGAGLSVADLDYAKMGAYKVVATSSKVPNLTIESARKYLWATTEVFGNVYVNDVALSSGSEVSLFRIMETGAYDSTSTARTLSNGSYALGEVVLGNFILKVAPDQEVVNGRRVIQTYYVSEDDWSKADVLEVLQKQLGVNVDLIYYTPIIQPKGAQIGGFLESELPDAPEVGSQERVDSRRKVRKAGCSMRRFKSTGKDDQEVETEIAYYIETDDEGYFNFEGVAPGRYLLNIQFPGIPMDASSEVEFFIDENKENQVFEVNALITELGIVVEQKEILFNWKPFIKDVVMYPNPTEGMLTINYTVYRTINDLKLKLVALDGQTLEVLEADYLKGNRHTRVDLTSYAAGQYYLIFTDERGSFNQTVKVLKK